MDPLAQTIALLRPKALLWKQLEATGGWAIRFPANSGVVFSLVTAGRCVFQGAGLESRVLREGDFLLMAGPKDWTLGDDENSTPRDFERDHARAGARVTTIGDGAGPVTRILGGRFVFEESNAVLLEGLLPAFIEIRSPDARAARLRRVLDLLGDEALAEHPGREFVLERLLELMLVEVIRTRIDRPDGDPHRGLLAGLADHQIALALRAIHTDIQKNWTVATLARISAMSRSVFAERFSRVVGQTPIDYLLHWRMAVAKDALKRKRGTLADIARTCGYGSVSAFSTAFTRTVGCPPSAFAARHADAPEAGGVSPTFSAEPNPSS